MQITAGNGDVDPHASQGPGRVENIRQTLIAEIIQLNDLAKHFCSAMHCSKLLFCGSLIVSTVLLLYTLRMKKLAQKGRLTCPRDEPYMSILHASYL